MSLCQQQFWHRDILNCFKLSESCYIFTFFFCCGEAFWIRRAEWSGGNDLKSTALERTISSFGKGKCQLVRNWCLLFAASRFFVFENTSSIFLSLLNLSDLKQNIIIGFKQETWSHPYCSENWMNKDMNTGFFHTIFLGWKNCQE